LRPPARKADFGGVVTRDDSIKTAADLAGKRVVVNTLKSIGDSTIRASVPKAGGDRRRSSSWSWPSPTCRRPSKPARWTPSGCWSNYVDTAPDLTVAVSFTSEQLTKDDPDWSSGSPT
jgi:NitT/TauT family transport system substrate-binding protein